MNGEEFFDKVEAHPDLEGLDIDNEVALIKHIPTDHKYRIELATIAEKKWEVLEAVLTGKRDAKVLKHMTRVVGYYSLVQNWNVSKLAELSARQSGEYSTAGS